jgi:hypothetical protein
MMDEMNISTAKWLADKVTGNNQAAIRATIDGQEWDVPLAADNRHYAEIMRQVKAGDLTIADAD